MSSIQLTDRQWAFINPLLPPPARTGRPRANDRRTIAGIFYVFLPSPLFLSFSIFSFLLFFFLSLYILAFPFLFCFLLPPGVMLTLLLVSLLARGRRTVTAALWLTGHQLDPHFSTFHQALTGSLVAAPSQPALAAAHHRDLCPGGRYAGYRHRRTLERRWGAQIRNAATIAIAPCPARRSVAARACAGSCSPWPSPCRLPGNGGVALSVSAGHHPRGQRELGLRHKTLGLRARQAASLLRRWLPGVPIKLLVTSLQYLELGLHCTHHQITLIAPFRLDSAIHEPTRCAPTLPGARASSVRGYPLSYRSA